MIIRNSTKSTQLADNAWRADSFFSRLKGLIGHKSLEKGEALIITRCQSIHMFFMRFAIDAIFVDKHNCVVGCVKRIKPFCLSRIFRKSNFVIELPVGIIEESKTELGDIIEIKD